MSKRVKTSQPSIVGESRRADQITGRITLLETKEDFKWAFDVLIKMPSMTMAPPKYVFLYPRNVTSMILIGNEDAPDEVWATTVNPVLYNSRFWRLV